jgi:hypothetical protein
MNPRAISKVTMAVADRWTEVTAVTNNRTTISADRMELPRWDQDLVESGNPARSQPGPVGLFP